MAALKVWIAALGTIGCLSFVYGDNVVYQFCEHALLGFTAAHLIVQGYFNIVNGAWNPLVIKGQLIWLVPIVGGLLLYCRFIRPVRWLSRLPLAFMVGGAAGLSVQRSIDSEFMKQLAATCGMNWKTANGSFYILAVVLTLAYFVVGLKEKSPLGRAFAKVGTLGQYVMMLAFGAGLGVTVSSRISTFIGRMQFLLGTWLGLIK